MNLSMASGIFLRKVAAEVQLLDVAELQDALGNVAIAMLLEVEATLSIHRHLRALLAILSVIFLPDGSLISSFP